MVSKPPSALYLGISQAMFQRITAAVATMLLTAGVRFLGSIAQDMAVLRTFMR